MMIFDMPRFLLEFVLIRVDHYAVHTMHSSNETLPVTTTRTVKSQKIPTCYGSR